ncbi:hypothetical protein HH310_42365 [Actinoplanes sp. TBRC 11911]|uniref:hypothetical protein n=1 Tax=Actinoplanes sp. TBRC 11911 TaxID=2729386 RepID=UPI00145D38CD|nr:hypothetical protein [Actinoplanes sp. TBRC 11911]NMO57795.1 hypothetical protein [Actinoplanes sp. TBRC 11911]
MDFWDATKVLVRRWYLALPLLLLTFAGTGYTATQIEADYVLTSYVQLIPPQTPPVTEEEARKIPVNPWNQLGLEALSQASNYATVDRTFLERLEKEGYSTNFKITSGDPVAGATIEVIGLTREQAVETTDAVIKRFKESTLKLQTQYRVRTQDLITVERLDQGENLDRPGGKVKRAIIAVFGTGMLLTAAVTIGFDAWLRRRRRRKDEAALPEPTIAAAPVSPSPRVFEAPKASETVRIQFPEGTIPPRKGTNGVAKAKVKAPSEPRKDSPGEATIILPGPRQSSNDNGGHRR